jgi:hypothetical protein
MGGGGMETGKKKDKSQIAISNETLLLLKQLKLKAKETRGHSYTNDEIIKALIQHFGDQVIPLLPEKPEKKVQQHEH